VISNLYDGEKINPCFGVDRTLGKMRAFYRSWPIEVICQTPSGKSSPLEAFQTLTGRSSSVDGIR
jgi:hypothetical protein